MYEASSTLPTGPWSVESAGEKSARPVLSSALRVRAYPDREGSRCASPLELLCSRNKFCADGQLVRCQAHRFLGHCEIHAGHFKHDASGFHHGDPVFRNTFALTHAGFGRLLGERLIRKNTNPKFSAALHETRDRDARRFDLAVGNPRRFERLQSKLPNARLPPRHALPARRPRCCLRYFTFFGINIDIVAPVQSFIARQQQRMADSFPECARHHIPSTSRQSRRRLCWPARNHSRYLREAFAMATGLANTIPCGRFLLRSNAHRHAL